MERLLIYLGLSFIGGAYLGTSTGFKIDCVAGIFRVNSASSFFTYLAG